MKKQFSHEFSLYVENLSALARNAVEGSVLRLDNPTLCHRISSVLRLPIKTSFVVFDRQYAVRGLLEGVHQKRYVEILVEEKTKNIPLAPPITFFLPLLKRDAFETALYSMVELGATVVQPVLSKKIHRMWVTDKEHERLHRIMVAAAEQSKNYAFPQLNRPLQLEELLEKNKAAYSVYFDPAGIPFDMVVQQIEPSRTDTIRLMVGPEGDLTAEEKELLQKYGFTFCTLTPTVIRAHLAAVLGLGIFRSFYK